MVGSPYNDLPHSFVASSKNAKALAKQLRDAVKEVTTVQLWWQDEAFPLGGSTLENLIDDAYKVDFAAIVFTPDDELIKHGKRSPAPRDNVIFEAGLFIGRLGRERTFLVTPSNLDLALPTDLLGITTAMYDPDAGIAEAGVKIGAAIENLGRRGLVKHRLIVEVPSSTKPHKRSVGVAGTFDTLDAIGGVRTGRYWKPMAMKSMGQKLWQIELSGQPMTSIKYKYVLSPKSGWAHVEVNTDGTDRDDRTLVLPQVGSEQEQKDVVEGWKGIDP